MSKPSQLNVPALVRCPRCGGFAEAEPVQLQGRSSLICPRCGFHWYVTPKVNGVAQVWEGERVEVVGLTGLRARHSLG